jgi:hypothetical protein
MELDEKDRRQLLKEEYFFIQSQYEDFDKRSLQIKGWISAGSIAAIAVGFTSASKFAFLLPIFVAIIAGVFWYLEARWKLFQYAFQPRIRVIEAYFRNDPDVLVKNPDPLQVFHWWFLSYSKGIAVYEYEKSQPQASWASRFRLAARQRFVYLPYLPMIGISILSAIVLGANTLLSWLASHNQPQL